MHQHTAPTYPVELDTLSLAFMRGIAAAMPGDRDSIQRATQEIQAATADYIEQAG